MPNVASLGVCSSARTCVGDFRLRLLEGGPPAPALPLKEGGRYCAHHLPREEAE